MGAQVLVAPGAAGGHCSGPPIGVDPIPAVVSRGVGRVVARAAAGTRAGWADGSITTGAAELAAAVVPRSRASSASEASPAGLRPAGLRVGEPGQHPGLQMRTCPTSPTVAPLPGRVLFDRSAEILELINGERRYKFRFSLA